MSPKTQWIIDKMDQLTSRVVDMCSAAQDGLREYATSYGRDIHRIAVEIAEHTEGGYVDPNHLEGVVPDIHGTTADEPAPAARDE